MDRKTPPLNIVIKQEPVTDAEELTPEPVASVETKVTPEPAKKKLKSSKKKSSKKSPKKLQNSKEGKHEVPNVVKEKVKRSIKVEPEVYVEPPRAEVFPDCSMMDFYCKVCDSHMNSIQVWESHIQGRRHLKNTSKKESMAPASTVPIKKEKPDDVAGLYYIDTRGAPSPSYDSTRYERRSVTPPPSMRRHHPSPDNSHARHLSPDNSHARDLSPDNAHARHLSPDNAHARHLSPDNSRTRIMTDFGELYLTHVEQMDYIRKLTDGIIPETEEHIGAMKDIISCLSKHILKYEIRQLPMAMQQCLKNEVEASSDEQNL